MSLTITNNLTATHIKMNSLVVDEHFILDNDYNILKFSLRDLEYISIQYDAQQCPTKYITIENYITLDHDDKEYEVKRHTIQEFHWDENQNLKGYGDNSGNWWDRDMTTHQPPFIKLTAFHDMQLINYKLLNYLEHFSDEDNKALMTQLNNNNRKIHQLINKIDNVPTLWSI